MDAERPADGPAAGRARARMRGALPVVVGLVAAAAAFAVVAPIADRDDPEPVGVPATVAQPADSVAAGRLVFARMGCGNCHELAAANAKGQIGPNLDQRLAGHDRASLAAKITDPYPDLPPDTFAVMPEDFGERMSASELEALIAFLLEARRYSSP